MSQAGSGPVTTGRPLVDTRPQHKETDMGSSMDDAKGRVKEAAGDLTDNKDLEREGKMDQAGAKAKDFVEKAKDKVEDLIDSAKGKADRD